MERISTPLLAVGKAMVAACEFFTVIDAPAPQTGTLKEPDVSATEDITFENVTFAYPGRPHVKVLDDLNLTIQAGKLTAIVGPSGSGKSTIVGLIERWYTLQDQYVIEKTVEKDKTKKKSKKGKEKEDITDEDEDQAVQVPEETGPAVELKGSVSTAGHDLGDLELKWWRSQIGLVQQEPFLFNDTIFRNVAYGLVGSQWENEPEDRKRELVKEACKEAFADEFIDRLPDVGACLLARSAQLLTLFGRATILGLETVAPSCLVASANDLPSRAASSESPRSSSLTKPPVPSTFEARRLSRPHWTESQ